MLLNPSVELDSGVVVVTGATVVVVTEAAVVVVEAAWLLPPLQALIRAPTMRAMTKSHRKGCCFFARAIKTPTSMALRASAS